MRDSILRVIDDLETRLVFTDDQLRYPNMHSSTGNGILEGRRTMLMYSIQELRKVLDENPKV